MSNLFKSGSVFTDKHESKEGEEDLWLNLLLFCVYITDCAAKFNTSCTRMLGQEPSVSTY